MRRTQCRGTLRVNRNGLIAKTRRYTVLPGFTLDHNLGVYNNCVDTVERAFTERYFLCEGENGFRPALPVSRGQFEDCKFRSFRAWVLAFTPKLPVLDRQSCVDLFPASKRKVYQEAFDSFSSQGPLTAKDARLKSFVKFEKQDVVKAPRVINPRSPRFNLEVARYLKHLEHHLYRSIHKTFRFLRRGNHRGGGVTVFKGLDADASARALRSKWSSFKRPVAVGLDARKFDMHVSKDALKYEHSFYNEYWRNPYLRWILRMQLRNKGVARCDDGTVRFEMEGTRTSGDINTSLGNCLLMCAMVWAFCDEHDFEVELANNGDDCVIIMEMEDYERFMQTVQGWFTACGFDMVIEAPVTIFEEIEFCQTHPVELSSGWRMVRNPFTCFRKDTMCLRPIANDKVYRKWLYAVGDAGSSLCSGVPVLSSFYRMMTVRGLPSTKFKDLVSPYRFARASNLRAVITPEARASFFFAFGIDPDAQVEMEKLFGEIEIEEVDLDAVERSSLVFGLPGAQILRHDIYHQFSDGWEFTTTTTTTATETA